MTIEPTEQVIEALKVALLECKHYRLTKWVLTQDILLWNDDDLGPNYKHIRSGDIIIKAHNEKDAIICFLGLCVDLEVKIIIETLNKIVTPKLGSSRLHNHLSSYSYPFRSYIRPRNSYNVDATSIYSKLDPQQFYLNKLVNLIPTADYREFEEIIKSDKVDINKPLSDGSYLLEIAIREATSDLIFVKILLEAGAKVNYINNYKDDDPCLNIPLCVAISYRRKDIVELLLKYGADVNFPPLKDRLSFLEYNTPLYAAANYTRDRRISHNDPTHSGWPEMVKMLLELGAHPLAYDSEGRYAIEFTNNKECIDLLNTAMDKARAEDK